MPDEPPNLARELRKEACPPRVIDAVSRRIAAETPPPHGLRLRPYAVPMALAGLVLLCGLSVWWRPTSGTPPRQPLPVESRTQAAPSPAQVVQEAKSALGLIGAVLLDAGQRSQTVISDRAMAPLRREFAPQNPIIIHL